MKHQQFSLKAVCTDRMDLTAGEIMKPDQILIVEVKRGGFEITEQEVSQVEYYVRQIRKSAVLHSSATIDAYVVGAKLGDIDPEKETTKHYDALGQESIVEQALRKQSN